MAAFGTGIIGRASQPSIIRFNYPSNELSTERLDDFKLSTTAINSPHLITHNALTLKRRKEKSRPLTEEVRRMICEGGCSSGRGDIVYLIRKTLKTLYFDGQKLAPFYLTTDYTNKSL